MTTQEGVPPDSLVVRMIGELNANPEVRTLLLRALLTDDFLLLPAKVDRLMELPTKVDKLQEDVSKLMELPAKVDRLQEEVRQDHNRPGPHKRLPRPRRGPTRRSPHCSHRQLPAAGTTERRRPLRLRSQQRHHRHHAGGPEELRERRHRNPGQPPRHRPDPLHCRRGVVHRRGGRHPPRPAQRPVPDAVHRPAGPCRGGRTATHTGSRRGHQAGERDLVRNRAQTPRTGLSRLNRWTNPGRTVRANHGHHQHHRRLRPCPPTTPVARGSPRPSDFVRRHNRPDEGCIENLRNKGTKMLGVRAAVRLALVGLRWRSRRASSRYADCGRAHRNSGSYCGVNAGSRSATGTELGGAGSRRTGGYGPAVPGGAHPRSGLKPATGQLRRNRLAKTTSGYNPAMTITNHIEAGTMSII